MGFGATVYLAARHAFTEATVTAALACVLLGALNMLALYRDEDDE